MNKILLCLLPLCMSLSAFCQSYEIFVSDAGNFSTGPWQILKYDEDGSNGEVFISANLSWPQDIVFLEDQGVVLISNLNTGRITKYNATDGSYISNFATGLSGPTRMKIGADSLLYVLQWSGNGKVIRYQLDGTLLDEFTDTAVPQSIGLDWDSAGNLYVSSYNGDMVRKFDTAGNDAGIFVNTNLEGPTNIWFDTNGDLLVVDYNGTAVKRFSSSGAYLSDFMTGLSNAEGVDFFPNGDILIGNGANSSVKRYDSTGTYIEDLISSGPENLLIPNAVVIREKMEVGIVAPQAVSAVFIYPSMGSEFHLMPNAQNPVKLLQLYTATGRLVEELDGPVESFHTDKYVDGIYFVVATFESASVFYQKIIVNR